MDFPHEFRDRLSDLFRWRRDVRHFRPDPLPDGLLESLLELACLAPSVGLSQPWRFVTVDDPDRRGSIRANFRTCNEEALAGYRGERAERYAALKLEGLDTAPVQLAILTDIETPQGHGLGRVTMPETLGYSTAMAAHTLWLAARAAGVGMGWVSILDPAGVVAVLDLPRSWTLAGYFCIGLPAAPSDVPELERRGWERRAEAASLLHRR